MDSSTKSNVAIWLRELFMAALVSIAIFFNDFRIFSLFDTERNRCLLSRQEEKKTSTGRFGTRDLLTTRHALHRAVQQPISFLTCELVLLLFRLPKLDANFGFFLTGLFLRDATSSPESSLSSLSSSSSSSLSSSSPLSDVSVSDASSSTLSGRKLNFEWRD